MALHKSERRLAAFHTEMNAAEGLRQQRDLAGAFRHLERAHILGQPWPVAHTHAHIQMLKIGIQRRDVREVVGQIIRITGGGILSLFGRLPEGNTGGADVSAVLPMPSPADLKALCEP